MAEAPPCTSRFFCHRCSLEIIPRLPDYMCPQCESGFIEELLEERSADNGSMSNISSGPQNQQPLENMDQQLSMFPSGFGQFSVSVFDDAFDLGPGLGTEDNRDAENQSERDMSSRQRYGARQSRSRHGSRRQAGRHDGAPTLEGIIQQLVNGILGPPVNIGVGAWGVLHSNPMDYAWGANGLDAIITQLLNQFENSGPPPADGDKIRNLPTLEITDEHVASGLECSVCKEDYSVGENVRQLPCNHMFHNDCIVPWLEQHDTCPVCRTSLTGLNTATNPPELSEMNFSSSPSSSLSSSSSSPSSSSTSSSPPSLDSTSTESSTDNS
ncbi:PREDICTED: E3 ubiquitin-protein ligase RNF126 [Poecilia mexicana]|uniref:RING-type E3 ubiquitin transferase n=2 Tax=Poecilia TaxID=8080 RepID=A0A096LVW1_POEFO|nr:PREDICTED: E3 ubiquitin-protein ligase RNF126-like [Poecilia formosa]XP_014861958.1 PREDICTED: E3 ubiquitin-protein ligase RNF126 [Poecilia mexicana]